MLKFISLGSVVLLVVCAAAVRQAKGVKAMSVQVNVKGVQEHGIRIILPTDAEFEEMFFKFTRNQPADVRECIRPLSVIVENRSKHAIVGTRIRWEILKEDGTTFSLPVGSVNPAGFESAGRPDLLQRLGPNVILSGATGFLSNGGRASDNEVLQLDTALMTFRGSEEELNAFNREINNHNYVEAFKLSQKSITNMLRGALSVTVSVDGIFFDDGGFVGENETGLFEDTKAYLDAEYDFAKDLLSQRRHKTEEEILSYLSEVAKPLPKEARETSAAAVKMPDSKARATRQYDFCKMSRAQQLLRMKDVLGASRAIDAAIQRANRPRIELRKLQATKQG